MNALLLSSLLFASPGYTESRTSPVPVASVKAEMRLGMRKSGELSTYDRGGRMQVIDTYILTVGDPGREDERYARRAALDTGIFTLDSAQYFHNQDTTWRLYDFRSPSEGELDSFIDFMTSPAGRDVLKEPYARTDFGKPGEFVYKKMRVLRNELPAPLNRASAKALEPIAGIFQYNADGTMKIYLKEPLDHEQSAERICRRLKKEIEGRPGACRRL